MEAKLPSKMKTVVGFVQRLVPMAKNANSLVISFKNALSLSGEHRAQPQEPKNDGDWRSDTLELMRRAIEAANSCSYTIVSSLDSSSKVPNSLISRTVEPFKIELEDESPAIYFNTSKLSQKVRDFEASPRVTLTYLNESRMSCVSFCGSMERVPYPASLRHWNPKLFIFYPNGPHDTAENPDCVFTTWRFSPDKITLVSLSEGIVSSRADRRPPTLSLSLSLEPAGGLAPSDPSDLLDPSLPATSPTRRVKWTIACNGQDS